MTQPFVDIEPNKVAEAGAQITADADSAAAAIAGRYDSAGPAAAGNPGFAAGAAAAAYSTMMETETRDAVATLRTMGERIVSGAHTINGADQAAGDSLNRIVDALQGLT
jgi:hypothetical protein